MGCLWWVVAKHTTKAMLVRSQDVDETGIHVKHPDWEINIAWHWEILADFSTQGLGYLCVDPFNLMQTCQSIRPTTKSPTQIVAFYGISMVFLRCLAIWCSKLRGAEAARGDGPKTHFMPLAMWTHRHVAKFGVSIAIGSMVLSYTTI